MFLSTTHYPQGKLILRKKSAEGYKLFEEQNRGKEITRLPFALHGTHLMMAKGSLNDQSDLTYFVDSGLASQASLSAPTQTLKYAGIPLPKKTLDPDGEGGGGGVWASGSFAIQKLALGSLSHENVLGEYGSRPDSSYWANGFIEDGLISHSFLRRYAWTIDFDKMQYSFTQGA